MSACGRARVSVAVSGVTMDEIKEEDEGVYG